MMARPRRARHAARLADDPRRAARAGPPGEGGPTVIISDQASYSDQIFGLFWLLGYQFSPPAGLPDQRFWRIDRHANYGPLDGLARNRINARLICEQWEDILRVAGSLWTGTVRASELLRVLQGGGRPSRLGRAIAELGRIAKTLHLLAWIDSEQLRRETGIGLNRHESRHSVARIIFHGNQGQLRQPYREGQEDQLGARLRAQRDRALERPIPRRRHHPATRHRAPDHRRRPPADLTAAARAHQDPRPLPLHPAPRPHSRHTATTAPARPSGLAYVPVPLLPGGRLLEHMNPSRHRASPYPWRGTPWRLPSRLQLWATMLGWRRKRPNSSLLTQSQTSMRSEKHAKSLAPLSNATR